MHKVHWDVSQWRDGPDLVTVRIVYWHNCGGDAEVSIYAVGRRQRSLSNGKDSSRRGSGDGMEISAVGMLMFPVRVSVAGHVTIRSNGGCTPLHEACGLVKKSYS